MIVSTGDLIGDWDLYFGDVGSEVLRAATWGTDAIALCPTLNDGDPNLYGVDLPPSVEYARFGRSHAQFPGIFFRT